MEFDDTGVADSGYAGGALMGLTPLKIGPTRILLPTWGHPTLQKPPEVSPDSVRFVQTAGGRPGFSFIMPIPRWTFIAWKPAIIWTTLALTIHRDGSYQMDVVGASAFPRHWVFDDAGELSKKVATTRFANWFLTTFGSHSPWGDAESPLERALSAQIMQGALVIGNSVTEQCPAATALQTREYQADTVVGNPT